MTEIAEAARGLPDARVRKLIDWIRENMCPDCRAGKPPAPPTWNDTARPHLHRVRRHASATCSSSSQRPSQGTDRADERIAVFHGPTPPDEREEIKRAFNADPSKHPLRILIATDAAREGLNLQAHCGDLFHFDVPWNPSRMEQRNGRIDRKLQPQPEVCCHYFVYQPAARGPRARGAGPQDRDDQAGAGQPVPGHRRPTGRDARAGHPPRRRSTQLEARDRRRRPRRRHRGTRSRKSWKPPASGRTALREQIERLADLLDRLAGRHRLLDKDHFRSALSCALELLGADAAQPLDRNSGRAPRLDVPALDQRARRRPDLGRHARHACGRPGSASRSSGTGGGPRPIRPVVFEDPGMMTDEVVHLHLEHRVVQRLLGRFTAQGFVHHDLVPGLPGADVGRDPARGPARPALPLRPRSRPAARGTDSRSPPAGPILPFERANYRRTAATANPSPCVCLTKPYSRSTHARSPFAGSCRAGGLYPIRIGLTRYRGRTGYGCPASGACARDYLVTCL